MSTWQHQQFRFQSSVSHKPICSLARKKESQKERKIIVLVIFLIVKVPWNIMELRNKYLFPSGKTTKMKFAKFTFVKLSILIIILVQFIN